MTLDVRDDGRGFDPAVRPVRRTDGGGLRPAAMRQRVRRVAGRWRSSPNPGGGTARRVAPVPAMPGGATGVTRRTDPAADRRRPPGRPGRAARHVRRRPEFEVLGEAGRRRRGGRAGGALRPGRRPDGPADAGHGRGRPRSPSCAAAAAAGRVLVLTTYDTDSDVLPAIEAGATGYLLKDAPRDELFRAVRRGAPRRVGALARRWPSRLMGQVSATRPRTPLSQRELEVLRWSPAAPPTGRRRGDCSSARPPSRPTCCTSTPSSASATAPRRWRPRSSGACWCPRALTLLRPGSAYARRRGRRPVRA